MKHQRQHTVLVVEDNPLNLELVQAVLEARGFRVLAATDAQAGIEIARRELPDVVLMDVQLPGTDGLQATRLLRSDPDTTHIPVIAVTAHVKKDDEARCIAAGCILHLPKPVDTRTLPETVERVIESAGGAPEPAAVPGRRGKESGARGTQPGARKR